MNTQPYTVVDLITRFRLPYKFGPGYLEPFLMFQNLLNTEYKQALFFFESRLATEPAPVADIHFTPGPHWGGAGRGRIYRLSLSEPAVEGGSENAA